MPITREQQENIEAAAKTAVDGVRDEMKDMVMQILPVGLQSTLLIYLVKNY